MSIIKRILNRRVLLISFALIIIFLVFISWPLDLIPFLTKKLSSKAIYLGCIIIVFILFLIKEFLLGNPHTPNNDSGTVKNNSKSEDKPNDSLTKSFDLLLNLFLMFLGVLLALQLTAMQDWEAEKEKYLKLLRSSIKSDEFYIDESIRIINFLNTANVSTMEVFTSIENVKNQLILEEIIKNGYLYEYSSDQFINEVTKIISDIRKNNLEISPLNRTSFKKLVNYLIFKEQIINSEIRFIQDSIDTSMLNRIYKEEHGKLTVVKMQYENDKSSELTSKEIDSIQQTIVPNLIELLNISPPKLVFNTNYIEVKENLDSTIQFDLSIHNKSRPVEQIFNEPIKNYLPPYITTKKSNN